MRAEDAGARTWLYAAFAGWAVLVWVLAMFGMGGSIDRLDDDPGMHRALPSPVAPGNERLGPIGQYGDLSARPLFTDNRRPQPFVIDPMGEPGEANNAFDYVLTSVLRTPALQMVIQQPGGGGEPVRVKQGDAPAASPGWVLQSVEARKAVFAGPDGEQALELRVFDGVGGQSPTAMVPPASASAPDGTDGMPAPSPAVASMPSADASAAPGAASAPSQPVSEPGVGPGGPVTPEAQQQAAQQQVDMIRKRIEERRARLRQEERAQATPRASENK